MLKTAIKIVIFIAYIAKCTHLTFDLPMTLK